MTITFKELCQILATEKLLSPEFWKDDPLYIQLGKYSERFASDTEPFHVIGDPDIAIDVNAQGDAIGIEFVPL
jgi:uncharacterized protein YuzE